MSILQSVPAEAVTEEESALRSSMTSAVYLQLRSDLLSGKFMPDARLGIKELQDRYGTGATPIREVLNRLAAEGFVIQIDQRGFRVPPFSLDELSDLTRTRCLINEILFTQAIAAAKDADDEAMVLAHFRMNRLPRDVPGEQGVLNPEAEQAHRRFHRSLIEPCRLRSLLDFEEKLFERSTRYRVLAATKMRHAETNHQHADILQAVLDKNVAQAVKYANAHIVDTAEFAAAEFRRKFGTAGRAS